MPVEELFKDQRYFDDEKSFKYGNGGKGHRRLISDDHLPRLKNADMRLEHHFIDQFQYTNESHGRDNYSAASISANLRVNKVTKSYFK